MKIDHNTDFIEGEVLLFDKPLYWTSFDLVKKVKNIIRSAYGLKKIKVGHAGTLDPLASGLMIICTGKKTKTINSLMGMDKEYLAEIKFGETTPSFDLETEVDNNYPVDHITAAEINKVLTLKTGEQMQVPPLYSAKNIEGKRAYEYARKGIKRELVARPVVFHELELLSYIDSLAKIRIRCSKGTYVRSFADDLGKWLSSGAYLAGLRRVSVGEFNVNDAMSIDFFEETIRKL